MTFHNDLFPSPSYGSSGGPGHSTTFLDSKGGQQHRIGRWDGARRTYDARRSVQQQSDVHALISFIINREGGLHSFPYKDWEDFSTGSNGTGTAAFGDVVIGTGDGSTTTFQLIKRYTSGSQTKVRNITRPVSGTVKLGVAGSELTEGVGFTVNYPTGVVTLASAPTLGQQVTAGCEFYVPVHFGPGVDAALRVLRQTGNIMSVESLDMIEDVEGPPIDDDFDPGGAFALTFAIAVAINPTMGRVASLTPTANADATLPPATDYEGGGPYMRLHNLSGSFTVTVKSGGSTIGTIGAGASKSLDVALVGGVNTWKLA